MKRLRIEESQVGGAVGEDQVLAVLGEPPAFAGVGERVQKTEGGAIVDQRNVVLPGELNERIAPVGQAFGEVLTGDILELKNAAGVEIFFAQR